METAHQTQHLMTIRTILKYTFGLLPIAAGLDKFTNLLVDWTIYINPLLLDVLPISGEAFMYIVGIIEIAAGIIVFTRPRLGGYIVMAWLAAIAINLITSGKYLDVAVRDLVMAIGAYSFARLTEITGSENIDANL